MGGGRGCIKRPFQKVRDDEGLNSGGVWGQRVKNDVEVSEDGKSPGQGFT